MQLYLYSTVSTHVLGRERSFRDRSLTRLASSLAWNIFRTPRTHSNTTFFHFSLELCSFRLASKGQRTVLQRESGRRVCSRWVVSRQAQSEKASRPIRRMPRTLHYQRKTGRGWCMVSFCLLFRFTSSLFPILWLLVWLTKVNGRARHSFISSLI